eukprot:TRINITY_DN16770_c0_g1_i1.p1 TRINITY_DN16770_c0_g1~~TRINITY_DN16770_c0_g1_i1.p1  ORF type:complete len:397 (+),score=59.60 TRINITY_DN16770_c0_g1_i1:82-1191(+)
MDWRSDSFRDDVMRFREMYVAACTARTADPVPAFVDDLDALLPEGREDTDGSAVVATTPLTPSQRRQRTSVAAAPSGGAAFSAFPLIFEEPLSMDQTHAVFEAFGWWPRTWSSMSALAFRRCWSGPDSDAALRLISSFLSSDTQPTAPPTAADLRYLEPIHYRCNLQSLELVEVGLTPEGCRQLGWALEQNECLKTLTVSRCTQVADEGAAAIAEGLRRNVALETLQLRMCCVGCAGAETLASALLKSPLRHLLLPENQLRGRGVCAIARVLPESKVSRLDVSGNEFGSDSGAVAALQEAASQSPTLTALDVGSGGMSSEVALGLLDKLSTGADMREVSVLDLMGQELIAHLVGEVQQFSKTAAQADLL